MTPRKILAMRLIRRHKFVKRAQIQRVAFPDDADGSKTRWLIREMLKEGLIRTVRVQAGVPGNHYFGPIYLPTEKGCAMLAAETGDMHLVLDCEPNTRNWPSFAHYLEMTDLFMTIDEEIVAQKIVQLPCLYHEHDIVNPDAAKRFRLYTHVHTEKRGEEKVQIVCNPDAAFEIVLGDERKAYYVEMERGTDTPKRASAKKAGGYYWLAQRSLYKQHFPEAQCMAVIAVCPNATWTDAMRRSMADKKGRDLWLFVARQDFKEHFLHEPILYRCDEEKPLPLVPPPSPPAAEVKGEKSESAQHVDT